MNVGAALGLPLGEPTCNAFGEALRDLGAAYLEPRRRGRRRRQLDAHRGLRPCVP
ncbi:MAG: hypothetical protein U0470_07960 [Anaerolineae bacterium]